MANAFDQFDEQAEQNTFDQFDGEAEQPSMSAMDAITGTADIIGSGVAQGAEDFLAGAGGMIAGRDIPQSVAISEAIKESIPDYEVGEKGQQVAQLISKAYQDYVPDSVKQLITEAQGAPEEMFQRSMDTSTRLREKGFDTLADVSQLGAPILAAATGAVPTVLEGGGALKAPSAIGRASATAQKVASPEKRAIAQQLERQAVEGDYIPAESTDLVPVDADPWAVKPPQADPDDLGLSGYTTTTAPYKLNRHGKVIDNPRHKIAQEAGFSDAILGLTERVNPDTKAKLNQMISSRERLFEIPESSVTNDPSIVTGKSLGDRLKIVKDTNKQAGRNIDKYVNNNLANIEVNTIPLMDRVAEMWGEKGINLDMDVNGGIDFGDLNLNKKGQKVINDLFDEIEAFGVKRVTAKDVHNLKRRIDEDIAYGKTVTGLDAKTQGLLSDFRLSTKEFLENQFPEYGRANAEYSKTVDVMNRIQKGAGKVDLNGEFTDANLGRMSRAIMSQRISRDEIMTAIKDLDSIAVDNGYKLKDDLTQQVHFANQLDDIWGPSRGTGFAGQSKQGAASAAADIAGGGIQGGVAIGKKAIGLLKKKQLDDKKKFKAMRELLKDQ